MTSEEMEEMRLAMIEHREKNFVARLVPSSDPEKPGEMTLEVSRNGKQFQCFSLWPAEAHKVILLLVDHYGIETGHGEAA